MSTTNNASAADALAALTAGLTEEKIKAMLERALFLQKQGQKEDGSNELSQLMLILRNLQQRQLMHQQQLQQQQLAQQNAPRPPNQTTVSGQVSANFTPMQLSALKLQILTYKLMSQNGAIPTRLKEIALAPSNIEKLLEPRDALPLDAKIIETTLMQKDAAEQKVAKDGQYLMTPFYTQPTIKGSEKAQKTFEFSTAPYNIVRKPFASHAHASLQQRLLLPGIAPSGLDPASVLSERELRLQSHIEAKIAELEALPINSPNGQSTLGQRMAENYQETVQNASESELQSILEIRTLKILDRQRKLREEIVKNMSKADQLSNVDRAAYRRLKKQSMKQARMAEKLERQQRLHREKKEKQKQLDYLQTICNHGRDLIAWHKAHAAKQGKLGRAVLQYHNHVEKEEQKRTDRLSKERIKALREDNEEAYLKLIDEAKDTRLTHLLRQTGTYLESLTRAVVDQQKDFVQEEEESLLGDEPIDEDMQYIDSHGKKVDYFQMAHKVKEKVSQPNILIGGTLKEYQLKGLQWMVSLYNNRLNGILADEMGLGKTIQTISLVTYLIEKKQQNGPFFIIVPLSTLTNWTLEFEKWAPSVVKIVYKGPPGVRKQIQQQEIKHSNFQVLLTTFEYVIKDRPALSKIRWKYMIIDEGHRMKNTNSKLTSVLRQYYRSRYRLILTGTPLQNNLPELWALLNFILPKIFNSVKSFEEWFNTPFSNQGVQDKVELNEEEQLLIIKRLHKVLRPFLLRRLKKDVESELPDKIERVIKCKLSALQLKLYEQMRRDGMLYSVGEKGRTGIKGLNNTIMQLRKICNHPFVFEDVENVVNPSRLSNDLLYRTSGKFELLDRMLPKLQKTGHRILIFFQMTQIMNIMEDLLHYRGFRYLRLDGSTKADDRSQLLHLFNAPNSPYFVFLLSTRAGGLGLNLQSADTVVIFDSDWNPHQDLQAQDRAHRIGQTKEVRIFRLITEDSVEESILARAQYKLDIDGKVIQAGKFDNRSTEEDREAFLRSLLENKNDEQDDVDAEDDGVDDEELNLILKRSDEEYTTFVEMDKEREREEYERWQAMGGRGKRPERLLQEYELPEVYRTEEATDTLMEELEFGRGQRAKEQVRYDDGLTERQWVRALEKEQEDTTTPAEESTTTTTGSTPKRRKIDKSSSSSSQILDNLKSQLDKISRDIAGISKDP
ncbi:ATP-dependent DNA helicase Snf21 [Umbelopsis nana]